jgi:hypothetical protein
MSAIQFSCPYHFRVINVGGFLNPLDEWVMAGRIANDDKLLAGELLHPGLDTD